MSKVSLHNLEGKNVGEISLPETIFDVPFNASLVHQVYVAQCANKRSGSAHTKVRSDVRGGGKKPWKQKGTGNARTGSIRNPIWRGGGTIFGPSKDRNYTKAINAKMRRGALYCVLSQKVRDGQMIVFDSLVLPEIKTVEAAKILAAGGVQTSAVIGLAESEASTYRAMRNIPKIKAYEVAKLNVKDLLETEFLLVSQESLAMIEEHFTAKTAKGQEVVRNTQNA